MGTWSRNFLLPKTNPAKVREIFVQWMERRGFDLMERPPLFECGDEERAAFLVSNSEWTILLYDNAFEEGDRVTMALEGFPAMVEVWIGDSDHWGYALFENGRFTCGSTLNRGCTHSSDPPASLADAEKFCEVLQLQPRLQEIKKAQRKWHLFADVPCRRFCRAIGAVPATLTARDVEGWNAGNLESREIADWVIIPLLFEKRKPLNSEAPGPILHALAARSFSPQESRVQVDPEFVKLMRRRVKVMVWMIRPFAWLIALPIVIPIWLNKHGFKKARQLEKDEEILGEWGSVQSPCRREDGWLINDRHGCRVQVPCQSENEKYPFIFGVFQFKVGEIEVSCVASRPLSVRRIFDLQKGRKIESDESFFVNGFPARMLTLKIERPDAVSLQYLWFIELPRAIYQFSAFQKLGELSRAEVGRITEIVKTFQADPKIQSPCQSNAE